jgi:hypothetical protein
MLYFIVPPTDIGPPVRSIDKLAEVTGDRMYFHLKSAPAPKQE